LCFGRVGADGCFDTATTTPWAAILINCRMLATGIQRRRSRLAGSTWLISVIRVLYVMSGFLFLDVDLAYTQSSKGCQKAH
jgi:hypothetical protein